MKSYCNYIFRLFRYLMKKDNCFLVVVCGSTGTGKSDLGIEIAKKFNGEVISADSMQIYKGLDIVTNKVTNEEMRGIPHHMISFYDPSKSDFNVHVFRKYVLTLVEKLWCSGKLPVIVGGTSYYIESILYDNYLIDSNSSKQDELRNRLLADYPTNDDLYQLLLKVDPVSCKLIHRNNRFRVLRALEIYYATGKLKSEHLQDQNSSLGLLKMRNEWGGNLRFSNTLLINLDADELILDERLNKRVDKMVVRGLRTELEQFYDKNFTNFDSHGIMQSIGFKEFVPYLKLSHKLRNSTIGENLFEQGCNLLKVHTRQYSRKQRKWIYHRILLRSKTRQIPKYVTLNTSYKFYENVVPTALKIIDNFFNLRPLVQIDADSKFVLMPLPESTKQFREALSNGDYQTRSNEIFHCKLCNIEIQSEKSWNAHLSGKRHRKVDAATKKTKH